MTLNGVMAVILRYFTEFGSFGAHCVKVVEDVVVKKFTFAISSPVEFIVALGDHRSVFLRHAVLVLRRIS